MSEVRTPIVFIRNDIPELDGILELAGPVVTPEQALIIDELAYLVPGITEPLTRTCEKGDKNYKELKQDKRYVERELLLNRSF